MCGNGVAIGTISIVVAHRPTLKVLTMGRTAWFEAAAGTSVRCTVVLFSAVSTAPAAVTTIMGSAWSFKFVLKSTSQQGDKSTRR